MKFYRLSILALFVPTVADAHLGIPSGAAIAKSSNKVTFAINHGCKVQDTNDPTIEHELDTLSVQIDIPAGIDGKTVRPMPSDFGGKPAVTKDGNGAVTSIKWTRDVADLQAQDDLGYYEITLKMTVNDVPFTRIPFVVTQTCKDGNGNDVTVVWQGPSEPEPSPRLTVVPKYEKGWNKLTLTAAVAAADFGIYFSDALIVWKGTAAFSKNQAINMLIGMTPGVTLLDSDLAAGDEIWVKY